MKLFRIAAVLTALSAVLVLSAPDQARAALTDDFSIISSFAPTTIDGSTSQSVVNLFSGPSTTLATPAGVVLGNVDLEDFSTSAHKVYTDTYSANYTITTIITDVSSGQTETLTIKGSLSGEISHPTAGGNYAGFLNNTYTSVTGINNTTSAPATILMPPPAGQFEVGFTLGSSAYTFGSLSYAAPGAPGGFHDTGVDGTFSGLVQSTAIVPEPSSAVLCGLGGLSLLGLLRRRKSTV